jgi:predicted nucleotidyltransferase
MDFNTIIGEKYLDFAQICENHNVQKVYIFGSLAKGIFRVKESDIDLLVSVDIENPLERGEALLYLWDNLEKLFDIKVNLLTEDSLKNPYLKSSIYENMQLVYDREKILV